MAIVSPTVTFSPACDPTDDGPSATANWRRFRCRHRRGLRLPQIPSCELMRVFRRSPALDAPGGKGGGIAE
jgi:hypothetical protein